jgi:hypothetical protein
MGVCREVLHNGFVEGTDQPTLVAAIYDVDGLAFIVRGDTDCTDHFPAISCSGRLRSHSGTSTHTVLITVIRQQR